MRCAPVLLAAVTVACAKPGLHAAAKGPACEDPHRSIGVEVRDTTMLAAPLHFTIPVAAARAFRPLSDSSEFWSVREPGAGWEFSIDRSADPEPGILSYGRTVRIRNLRRQSECRLENHGLTQTLIAYTASKSSDAIAPYIATLRIEGAVPSQFVHVVAYGPDSSVCGLMRHLAFSVRSRASQR